MLQVAAEIARHEHNLDRLWNDRACHGQNDGLSDRPTLKTKNFNVLEREMADREGFEPSIRLPVYTRSRRAPSTTRPPVRRKRHPLEWGAIYPWRDQVQALEQVFFRCLAAVDCRGVAGLGRAAKTAVTCHAAGNAWAEKIFPVVAVPRRFVCGWRLAGRMYGRAESASGVFEGRETSRRQGHGTD